MDARQFDSLVRALSETGNRRGILGILTTLPFLGGLFALLDADELDAKGRRKRRKQRHKKRTGKHKKHRKGKRKGKRKKVCTPESTAQTCAGKCGSVTNNCGQAVECGACLCDPPCPACQACDSASRQCVPDAGAVGPPCGVCRRCDGNGACVECAPCCDDVCCSAAGSICHLESDACCVPDSQSQTCAADCGSVTNNCGQEVDCGDCSCDPTCPVCQTCDPETGACIPSGNGDACDDGDPCITGSTCSGGVCGGGSPVVCDDPNECQNGPGACVPATGECTYPAKSDGTRCGDQCAQACTAGECGAGTPVVCDSPNECQTGPGTCGPGSGQCSYPARSDGTRCGDKCTQSCAAGACVDGPPACTATECQTAGTCDPDTGLCTAPTNKPNGTPCSIGRCCEGVCPPPANCLVARECCGPESPELCFSSCCSQLAIDVGPGICQYVCRGSDPGDRCALDSDCLEDGICVCNKCCGPPGNLCSGDDECCSGDCDGSFCN